MASMIGRVFERLTVVARSTRPQMWKCLCKCGKTSEVNGSNLLGRRTRSCGCLWREQATKHGASGTRTHASWRGMLSRCENPRDPSFDRYGAIGVAVAPEWRDFHAFVADMGERPKGMTIDRIDPAGNYCKANCRWADSFTQARNQRKPAPVIDTPRGAMRVCEASELTGIPPNVIRARIRLGWPAARLFEPVGPAHFPRSKTA